MGFRGVSEFAKSQAGESEWTSWMHKASSPVASGAGQWLDLSMAPGIPKYNAYVGSQGEATAFVGSGNNGLYVGPGVGVGQQKLITDVFLQSPSATIAPATFLLCDYLLHYPLTDMDDTGEQAMDNSLASLPRYADGKGVRAMLVTTTPQAVAGVECRVSYTNELGVPGRVSSVYTMVNNTGGIQGGQGASGALGTQSPFISLINGDQGIRSIDSVTMMNSAGGFCAVVLVRPLLQVSLTEVNTAVEIDQFLHRGGVVPEVLPGAYLNFIYTSGVTAISSVIRGSVSFAWR